MIEHQEEHGPSEEGVAEGGEQGASGTLEAHRLEKKHGNKEFERT